MSISTVTNELAKLLGNFVTSHDQFPAFIDVFLNPPNNDMPYSDSLDHELKLLGRSITNSLFCFSQPGWAPQRQRRYIRIITELFFASVKYQ